MTYEERKKWLCQQCNQKTDCAYVNRKMEYKCLLVEEQMVGWEIGYKDAIEKAAQYVYHLCAHPKVSIDCEELVEHFKKYMEEQE